MIILVQITKIINTVPVKLTGTVLFILQVSSLLDITLSVLYNEAIHFVNGGISNAHNDLWVHTRIPC